MSEELLGTARRLAKASPSKPRQWDLKRSISTSYYALFHAIAKSNADLAMGVGPERPDKAWTQTYRSLQHGKAKSACGGLRNLGFPAELIECGEAFIALQQARHDADYDPNFTTNRKETLSFVDLAEDAIKKRRQRPEKIDPPPLKWSALKYGLWSLKEDGDGKTPQARRDRREAAAG